LRKVIAVIIETNHVITFAPCLLSLICLLAVVGSLAITLLDRILIGDIL
jgi:hypothetical protein